MEDYINDLLVKYRNLGAQDIFFTEDDNLYIRHLGEIKKCDEIINSDIMNYFDRKYRSYELIKENENTNLCVDIDSSYEFNNLRYRINLFSSLNKRKGVIRIINNKIPTSSEIGINSNLKDSLIKNKGISLVVGKTCSGKSTTVASIVQSILDEYPWHIITLEDPIEYIYKNNVGIVSQRELGKDFYNYSDGIISSLRQSPDLIVIGEIRDKNTLKSTIMAAESGTGVISTLHALGSKMTIMRMISMFPQEERDLILFQISSYLNFIQSQKLVKNTNKMKLDYELIFNNNAISNTIKEGKLNNLDNLILLGSKLGMRKFET